MHAPSFHRRPACGFPANEVLVRTGEASLSGILATPADGGQPRCLVVAVPGAGMHAGYFDTRSAPGLSLLELGSRLGFTVWAPDRPGTCASAHLPEEMITLAGQSELLLDAIDTFSADHPVGAGVFLVGHSYGLKVAWAMAAQRRGRRFIGLDGAGSGIRYAFSWDDSARGQSRPNPPHTGDGRGDMWGPGYLYPHTTFARGSLPLHPMPEVQRVEGGRWPQVIRDMAGEIAIPMRITFGEHERLWPIDDAALEEIRELFINAPEVTVEIEPFAGHNISLGWSARAYHLRLLAFAEQCVLSATIPSPGNPAA